MSQQQILPVAGENNGFSRKIWSILIATLQLPQPLYVPLVPTVSQTSLVTCQDCPGFTAFNVPLYNDTAGEPLMHAKCLDKQDIPSQ